MQVGTVILAVIFWLLWASKCIFWGILLTLYVVQYININIIYHQQNYIPSKNGFHFPDGFAIFTLLLFPDVRLLEAKSTIYYGRYILVLSGATNYFGYMYACSYVIKFARILSSLNPIYPLVILCPKVLRFLKNSQKLFCRISHQHLNF